MISKTSSIKFPMRQHPKDFNIVSNESENLNLWNLSLVVDRINHDTLLFIFIYAGLDISTWNFFDYYLSRVQYWVHYHFQLICLRFVYSHHLLVNFMCANDIQLYFYDLFYNLSYFNYLVNVNDLKQDADISNKCCVHWIPTSLTLSDYTRKNLIPLLCQTLMLSLLILDWSINSAFVICFFFRCRNAH